MSNPYTKSGQTPNGTRPAISTQNEAIPLTHLQQDDSEPTPLAFHPKLRLTNDPSEAAESGDRKTSGNV